MATSRSKPSDAEGLRPQHLGHAADVDALEQQVLAERDRLLHLVESRRPGRHSGAVKAVVCRAEPKDSRREHQRSVKQHCTRELPKESRDLGPFFEGRLLRPSPTRPAPCPARPELRPRSQKGAKKKRPWSPVKGARGAKKKIRQRPTLPRGFPRSTIGSGGLNFRVRDGNGCDPSDIATGKLATRNIRRQKGFAAEKRSCALRVILGPRCESTGLDPGLESLTPP